MKGNTLENAYAYDPYGNLLNQQETIPQPFKFVGQYGVMAEPNGLYYMKARYYDPSVGRFISEDPTGFGGGDVNLMAYVQNNPVNMIDPMGTDGISTGLGIASAIAAIGSLIPGVDAVAIPVSGGLIAATALYTGYQAYKGGGIDFGSAKDLTLAAVDTAVLLAAKSFPLTSVLVGTGIMRPLNILNTGYDGVKSFSTRQCGR